MKNTIRKFIIKPLKFLAWVVSILIFLGLLLTLSTRLPFVQEIIKEKAIAYFVDKIGTNASIGSIYINFPSSVEVNQLYIEDLAGDTLLYAGKIDVATDLFDLLQNKLSLDDVYLSNVVGYVHNTETDSTFNYQFIIDGFSSGNSTDTPPDTSSSFDFAIYQAEIDQARVNYIDAYQGMELKTQIGHVLAEASVFDLIKGEIFVNSVDLSQASGSFRITKESLPSPDSPSSPFYVNGERVFIQDVDFLFEDVPGGIRVENHVGQAKILADSLNIVDQVYDAREIVLLDTRVGIDLFGEASTASDTGMVADQAGAFSLLASSENIVFGQVDFRFYDHSKPVAKKGFDPYHMWFQQINLKTSGIVFEDGYAEGLVDRLEATENRGFVLRNLSTEFKYGQQQSFLRNLHLETSNSLIDGDIQADYLSIEQISSDPEETGINLSLNQTVVSLQDVLYFVPTLATDIPATVPENLKVSATGNVNGKLSNVNFHKMEVSLLNQTRLFVQGTVKGLPDIQSLDANLPTLSFTTIMPEVKTFLPDSLFPTSLSLPDTIDLKGSVKGSLKNASVQAHLMTSKGEIVTDLTIKSVNDSSYQYAGKVDAFGIHLGEIIQNPDLGMLSLDLTFDGQGITREDIDAGFEGSISRLDYLGYVYDTVNLKGRIADQTFKGEVQLADSSLTFDFDGAVGFSKEVNEYAFDLSVERADLEKLNIARTEYKLIGSVSSRLTASSIDDINGYVMVKDAYVSRSNQLFPVDSLIFNASSAEDTTSYQLYSGFMEADFTGNFQLSSLSGVIRNHFSRYFALTDTDTAALSTLRPQSFDFHVDIRNPTIFTYLVPDLAELRTGEISGQYSSKDWMMQMHVDIHKLIYGGITADSLGMRITSDEFQLNYGLEALRLSAGPVTIKNILLDGDVESNNIMSALHIQDDNHEDRYLFGGIFISLEDHYRFMFTPGMFITNYNSWDVKPSNSIDIYPDEIWFQNLFFTNQEQELKFFSEVNDRADSVLTIDIKDLKLSQFGNITQDSVPIITGVVNGLTELNLVSSGLAFTSDLDIQRLSFKGDTLGNLKLQTDTEDGYRYAMDMSISGAVNDIQLKGEYEADSAGRIDMNLDVNRLALHTVESFTAGQVRNMEGNVSGQISIAGNVGSPDIDGRLAFQNVSFTPTYIGSEIFINDQQLQVNNTGLHFDSFKLTDEKGDEATLSGDIETKDLLLYDLNLDIATRNFKIINRPLPEGILRSDNPLYGNLDLTSDITIRGSSVRPVIRVSAQFGEGSNFTYVIPEESLTEQEQKGVVEWFDQDLEELTFFNNQNSSQKDSIKSALQGIDLKATLTVRPTNQLAIVIDPITGDKLTVQGDATLNYEIRPSGNQTLSGRYEVSQGSYVLNFYNLFRREFRIQEGSYILWTGDPLNAIMNVTALYEVRAAPIGVSKYQGKLDFLVYLDIGGQLLAPEISFRLGLAPDAPAPIQVEAWVNQQNAVEERVNRQVFGLLLFQTFFPDDSFVNSGNVNMVENTARSSVSRLLSSQLNRLSDQIKGVDLSIDIDSFEDYSSSGDAFGRTELELGVSKELFNERVVVKLAGNVDLEGNRSRQGVSDFAGDLQIEYKLTEDGRFRLVGFRNNDFDNLQGEIIRTGVGVIYIREYDALKELFQFGLKKKGGQDEE